MKSNFDHLIVAITGVVLLTFGIWNFSSVLLGEQKSPDDQSTNIGLTETLRLGNYIYIGENDKWYRIDFDSEVTIGMPTEVTDPYRRRVGIDPVTGEKLETKTE